MAITGKSVKSLKKTDLINQKSISTSFKKISFAHKATLNDAGFNLTTLNPPTELTSNGFSQPSTSDLASVSLQFYSKNLSLFSSARGYLVPFQDYTIGGNQQINFTAYFGTALADEIFYGTIDPVVKSGSLIADTNFILKTGTLAAGATDFNVGGSWKTNINPTQQLGAVNVYLDGVLQFRNSGNATAAPSADGNYQEVDNGSGEATLIKFNIADNLNDRVCMVMSNAISVVRPDGSVNDSIEKIQGSLDAVISTVADLAGVATTNFNASPTTPQLKQYGDRVVALETNAAYKNVSNTWTVAQNMLGKTDGAAIAAGYVGQVLTGTAGSGSMTSTVAKNAASLTISTPGVYLLYGQGFCSSSTTSTQLIGSLSTTSNTLDTASYVSIPGNGISSESLGVSPTPRYVNITATTTYYLVLKHTFAGTSVIDAISQIYAVRIA